MIGSILIVPGIIPQKGSMKINEGEKRYLESERRADKRSRT
jgi:hypothetical protein